MKMAFVFCPITSSPFLSKPNAFNKSNVNSYTKKIKSSIVCSLSRPSDDDDDLNSVKNELEALYANSPTAPITPSAPETLDKIKETGMESVKGAADELKSELEQVGNRLERFADDEAAEVLERYNEANRALVEAQQERIEEIKRDANRIKELTDSIRRTHHEAATPKQKLLSAVAFLLMVGALSYGFTGIMENNAQNLQFGAADALVAAALAFLASSEAKDTRG